MARRQRLLPEAAFVRRTTPHECGEVQQARIAKMRASRCDRDVEKLTVRNGAMLGPQEAGREFTAR